MTKKERISGTNTIENTALELTGQIISGRYRIGQIIGSGAFGTVYLADDLKLKKTRAVKLVRNLADNELSALRLIEHPAFPRLLDVLDIDGYTGLVMDYIRGTSLDRYCATHAVSISTLYDWMIQMSEIYRYIHSMTPAILYLDCKPSNIILGADGMLHPIDLGSAYICNVSSPSSLSGTLPYAPPEQRKGGAVDAGSDIYALGMTFKRLSNIQYRRLSPLSYIKHRFFKRDSYSALSYMIDRCIQDDPAKRYQSADELLCHLNNPAHIPYRFPSLKEFAGRLVNILYKCIVTLFTVLSLKMYASTLDIPYLALALFLFILLLCLSAGSHYGQRSLTYDTWYMEKDIFKGELSGTLLLILLCAALTGNYSHAMSYIPPVTVYNENGARVLYKGQQVIRDGDSLYLCIPTDSLRCNNLPCRIVVGK